MVRTLILIATLLLCGHASAANITVTTSDNPVSVDETFQISFRVEGKQDDEPDFSPLNKNFQLVGTSQSSSISYTNGKISHSKTYTLTVTALHKGKVEIPPIHFGKDKSTAVTITVKDTGYQPHHSGNDPQAQSDSQLIFITAETDTQNPYVQQQIILTIKIYRRTQWADASLSKPGFSGIEARVQSLGKEKHYETQKNGTRYTVTELRYALFPQESGQLTLKPFVLQAKFASGRKRQPIPGGFNFPSLGNFFNQQHVTRVARSKAIEIDVKPIPATFGDRHWIVAKDLQLRETWSDNTSQLKAGEPVTRTLTLIGDGIDAGQLPAINIKDHQHIKIYPDQPATQEQATVQGLLSTRTQKFALIPSADGRFDIPAIEVPWWSSQTDRMEIARLPQQTLVAAGIAAVAPATKSMTPGKSESPPGATAITDPSPASSRTSNNWLPGLSVGLFVLWIITLLAWLRARHNPGAQKIQPATEKPVSLKTVLASLDTACNNQQAAQVQDALLEWAKVIWPEHTPRSLEAISQHVNETFSTELNRLSSRLYGNPDTTWDAKIIQQQAKQINPVAPIPTPKADGLEPLYR